MKMLPIVYAVLTALCWGLYGPTLAKSRIFMNSPFKPYVAIGLAYLVWGILGGLIGMWVRKDPFTFTGGNNGTGMWWGLAAGTLGAWGALTLTLAMYSGGSAHPQVVMSIVFGGAVTVSALASVFQGTSHGKTDPMLYVGILGILISAIVVSYFTPHPAPPGGAKPAATTSAEESPSRAP